MLFEKKFNHSYHKVIIITVFIIFFIITNITEVFAYIDPNTGGYVFQLFFPIISAIAFAHLFLKRHIKMIMGRILSFIKSILKGITPKD